jgi:hypothetical protein
MIIGLVLYIFVLSSCELQCLSFSLCCLTFCGVVVVDGRQNAVGQAHVRAWSSRSFM